MHSRKTSMLLATVFIAAGCGPSIDLSERPRFDSGVNVFEAQVIDGQTGIAISNAVIQVHIGRDALDAQNDNGFYTVYGIPRGTFRVSVIAPGYQNFQAMKAFTNSSTNARLSNGDPLIFYFNNIVMFKEGAVPAPVTVKVYDSANGNVLEGANVIMTLDAVAQVVNMADELLPNVGLVPTTLSMPTDAAGMAVFPADTLILGGSYDIAVFGVLVNGIYMRPDFNNFAVTVGFDNPEIIVFLDRPTSDPVAITANNEEDVFLSELVVTFAHAIEFCSLTTDHDWSNRTAWYYGTADTDGDGTTTDQATVDPVTTTLTNADTVLTLSYATNNDDAGDNLVVRFDNVVVKPAGASDNSCTSLQSVSLRNVMNVNNNILVREP